MKRALALVCAFLSGDAAFAACDLRIADAVPARRYDVDHILFFRCHPTRNLVFSNEIGKDGLTSPVMINLDTGSRERIIVGTTAARGEAQGGRPVVISARGLDAVPSPSGNLLYAQVFREDARKNPTPFLMIYRIGSDNKITKIGEAPSTAGWDTYDYPSPLVRDGQEKLLYRSPQGLFIADIQASGASASVAPGRTKICGNIFGNSEVSMPYMSGDGQFLGASVNGQMMIFRLDWNNANRDGIPCSVRATLPEGASKPSFSADNTRVAFHTDSLDGLGRSTANAPGYNSFVVDLNSPQRAVPLSNVKLGQHSEFPSFCGSNSVAVRTTGERDTEFRIVSAPTRPQIQSYQSGNCTESPAPAPNIGPPTVVQ